MKTMKRILAFTLAFVLILTGICFTAKDGSEVKAETQSSEVNTDMLAVKVQVSTDNSAMRFISSVDSLDYASVGFEVTPAEEDAIPYTTNTVYERIVSSDSGMEYKFSPKVVDTSSEYMVTAKMEVDADTLYTVRAFVVTLAGETVYGDYRCVGVADAAGTTANMSFTSSDKTIAVGDTLSTVTYGATGTTTATVIGVNGTTVHVRAAVAPSELSSATKFTFGEAGSTIYRNLYTEYAGTADTTWYDVYLAENSEEDAFVIATNADLFGLASIVNGGNSLESNTVYLCSDIALNASGAVNWGHADGKLLLTGVRAWTPIGTAKQNSSYKDTFDGCSPFGGTFDGQDHTISGLYISDQSSTTGLYKAMFGATSSTATVKNFRLIDSYIKANAMAASIAGAGNGTFENIYSSATVNSNSSCQGGIIGRCDVSAVTIKNCWFDGLLHSTRKNDAQMGGIIGRITVDGSSIENCLNTGTMTTWQGTVYQLGGLVGKVEADSLAITNSLSLCTITYPTSGTQSSLIGGVVSGSVTLTGTYALEGVGGSVVGSGAVLDAEGAAITDMSTLQVTSESITGDAAKTTLKGFDFDTVWKTVDGSTPVLR